MADIGHKLPSLRAVEAAERRNEREAKKRLRDLERQAKEQAKLAQQEQARLELEQYENRLDVILSLHKEQGPPWDWHSIAAALPPPHPTKLPFHEWHARHLQVLAFEPRDREGSPLDIPSAIALDDKHFAASVASHAVEYTDWQQLDALARRLHSGDCHVYSDALLVCNPLAEIADLGSSFQFIPHSTRLLECRLKVNGIDAIPAEVKSLTAAGKLSVKPMPKARFHEIYQDYVCGCMLRVAREVFVLLPVDTLLITASADLFDSSTGKTGERPVVSAFLHRAVVSTLDFDRLDPSDAIDSFQHRGDFKATRKSGAFLPVAPLMPSDLIQNVTSTTHVADVLAQVKRLRMELTEECGELGPQQTSSIN